MGRAGSISRPDPTARRDFDPQRQVGGFETFGMVVVDFDPAGAWCRVGHHDADIVPTAAGDDMGCVAFRLREGRTQHANAVGKRGGSEQQSGILPDVFRQRAGGAQYAGTDPQGGDPKGKSGRQQGHGRHGLDDWRQRLQHGAPAPLQLSPETAGRRSAAPRVGWGGCAVARP